MREHYASPKYTIGFWGKRIRLQENKIDEEDSYFNNVLKNNSPVPC
jgi:hypothetical protein